MHRLRRFATVKLLLLEQAEKQLQRNPDVGSAVMSIPHIAEREDKPLMRLTFYDSSPFPLFLARNPSAIELWEGSGRACRSTRPNWTAIGRAYTSFWWKSKIRNSLLGG